MTDEQNGLERIARFYGAYFDHFEGQYYAPMLKHDEPKPITYREVARRKFIKYALHNGGLPDECYRTLVCNRRDA